MPRTTRSAQAQSVSKTSSAVLRPLQDPDLAPPASRLDGRPLRPIPFRPERGSAQQVDGAGLTKLGARVREVIAAEHGISPDDVDLGLVRLVEALNADTDRNLAALSSLQVKRTEQGVLHQVRFVANTPVILPWLTNGRALRRLGAALAGGHTKLLTSATDHPRYGLPTMAVEGVESVLEITAAQRRLLELSNYTSAAKKRDRIDSIVQFGVLEAPDVVLTQLISDDGSAWVAEAAEGAQRLFSSLVGLDALAIRNVHSIASAHWFSGPEPLLRDFRPADLEALEEELRFKSSAAAGYFPGADEQGWIDNTASSVPAAVAFQLMRTMVINLTIRVEPDPVTTSHERHPVAATIQELIRSYHVPGKMKDPWHEADVHGLVAIGVIDELLDAGRISAAERSAWLGERPLDWNGSAGQSDGSPGNRLVSATKLLAIMTTEDVPTDPEDEPSLKIVNRFLTQNSKRVHSVDRARVAAAQAVAALGLHASADEGTVAAALAGTFQATWFWKTSEQGAETWPDLLTSPLATLADGAQREREKAAGDPNLPAGPHQRAIAALGAVALIANPGLIGSGKALTRTGRGGGGKNADVKASDPNVLMERMVLDERGIEQLRVAIAALTLNAEQTIPSDPETGEILGDLELRAMWLGDGRDPNESPQAEFARQIKIVADQLKACFEQSEGLKTVTPQTIYDLDDQPDEIDFAEEPLYEVIGVNEATADEVLPLLLALNDFFTTGKAYARMAARASR